MAYADDLKTARDRFAAELATGAIKPSYSIGGQSVSWNEYRSSLVQQIKDLESMIVTAGGPVEFTSVGH